MEFMSCSDIGVNVVRLVIFHNLSTRVLRSQGTTSLFYKACRDSCFWATFMQKPTTEVATTESAYEKF
jgi:hypothetical protein